MPIAQTEVANRLVQGFGYMGYGGAGVFTGMTLADFDLYVRIAVGIVTCISIAVHLYFKIKSERNGKRHSDRNR